MNGNFSFEADTSYFEKVGIGDAVSVSGSLELDLSGSAGLKNHTDTSKTLS